MLVKPSLPVLRDAQHPEVRFSLPTHIIVYIYTLFEVTYSKSLQRVAVNKKGPFSNAVDFPKAPVVKRDGYPLVTRGKRLLK